MTVVMRFYVTINKDGLYHVQNAVMGKFGQHHVHTKDDFERWSKDISKDDITYLSSECDCGLKAGEVSSER